VITERLGNAHRSSASSMMSGCDGSATISSAATKLLPPMALTSYGCRSPDLRVDGQNGRVADLTHRGVIVESRVVRLAFD
jgi:hypothetical protein